MYELTVKLFGRHFVSISHSHRSAHAQTVGHKQDVHNWPFYSKDYKAIHKGGLQDIINA